MAGPDENEQKKFEKLAVPKQGLTNNPSTSSLSKEVTKVPDKVARPMNLIVTTQKAAIVQKEHPRPPSAGPRKKSQA